MPELKENEVYGVFYWSSGSGSGPTLICLCSSKAVAVAKVSEEKQKDIEKMDKIECYYGKFTIKKLKII